MIGWLLDALVHGWFTSAVLHAEEEVFAHLLHRPAVHLNREGAPRDRRFPAAGGLLRAVQCPAEREQRVLELALRLHRGPPRAKPTMKSKTMAKERNIFSSPTDRVLSSAS